MSARTEKFTEELKGLIEEGDKLLLAMQLDCRREAFTDLYLESVGGDEEKLEALIRSLPNFKNNYQAWYSKGQAVIKQVMPDRLADFVSYFEIPKGRKDITYQNYMIRDYLQGLQVTRGWEKELLADGSAAIPEFTQHRL